MKRSNQLQRGKPPKRKTPIRKHRTIKAWEKGCAVHVFPDGRERCLDNSAGKAEYKRRVYQAWLDQRRTCCLCDMPLRLDEVTAEHKIPRSRGRDDRLSNLGAAHGLGNVKKSSMSLDEYREKYTDEERRRFCGWGG